MRGKNNESRVVLKGASGERRDGGREPSLDPGRAEQPVLDRESDEPIFAELIVAGVAGFGDAIRVKDQPIAAIDTAMRERPNVIAS